MVLMVVFSHPVRSEDQTALSTPGSHVGGAAHNDIRIHGAPLPYPIWFATVMPGTRLEISVPPDHDALIAGKPASGRGALRFWTAPPHAGTHTLAIKGPAGVTTATVSVFVLAPASAVKDGQLNGFRMGDYRGTPPRGFIRLDEDTQDTPVAPNFGVGQFRGKQQPDHWPKYLVLSQNLVKRLQLLLDHLRVDGITKADTLFVMSGFRSPFYNTAIGATVRSRHMWGDAADVYVDVNPRDGVMDDLNSDGKITKADANWLYDYAARRFKSTTRLPRGGLGAYKANAVHGPFVHIDGRGIMARWGR